MRSSPLLRSLVLVPLVLAGAAASPLHAQEHGSADASAVNARTQLLVDRVLRLHACLTTARDRAIEAQQILEQAERVAADPSVEAAARADARETIRAVDLRLRRIESGIERCLAERGGFRLGAAPDPGVVYVDRPADPALERVNRDAPSLQVVERDVVLTAGVRVVRGERVDGTGRVRPERVRRAVRDVASEVGACWRAHVDRRTDGQGDASLVFTVGGDGSARRVRVEGSTLRDRRFDRCLVDAGRALRVEGGAQGGDVTYSYRLRFGVR